MSVSESLVVEAGGTIKLPERITDRYNLAPDTQLRIVEARGGILLIPLTNKSYERRAAVGTHGLADNGSEFSGEFSLRGIS